MTTIDPARDELTPLRELPSVAMPGDEAYDGGRQGFNVAVAQWPAAVAFPADAAEVADVVRAARHAGLRVAGQSTGHNAGPLGDLTHTVLVRTAALDEVTVDPARRIARVGAGVRWEAVVDAAAPHGLYPLHGSSPTVGVAGYSLGGGMGWLARSHGLQTNSLTAIELVTADGALVRTDADHDPELFWALRGGGGNFGIVTALEFRLYEVTEVHAGFMVWDLAEAARVLPVYARWAVDAPDDVTTSLRLMRLPPLPEIPEPIRGRAIVIVDGAVQGDPAVLEPLRALAPEIDTFAPMPAPALVRLHQDPEEPVPYVSETALIESLPQAAIDQLLALAGPKSGSPLLFVELRQAGGALARREPGHGAVGGIDGQFVLFALGMALDADMGRFMAGHLDALKAGLAPWTGRGSYLNFAESKVDVALSHAGDTLARLRAVKRRVDPDGAIHANHAI